MEIDQLGSHHPQISSSKLNSDRLPFVVEGVGARGAECVTNKGGWNNSEEEKLSNLRNRKTATFRHPDTREPLCCQILDQVWAKEPKSFAKSAPRRGSYGWRQPAFVAELIDWEGEKKVRFTYFVRRPGTSKFYFGGQYSPLMSLREYRAMMKKLSRKKW